MSYILEALKKSEQERQRGATPTLQSTQTFSAPREPRRQWLYSTLAVALAVGAFTIGLLHPWQMEPVTATASVTHRTPVAATAPGVAARPISTPPDATPIMPSSIIAQSSDEPRPRPRAAPAAPPRENVKIASVERVEGLSARSTQSQAAEAATHVDEKAAPARRTLEHTFAAKDNKKKDNELPALAELPDSVRAELPPMAISVHAYFSTPKERLVGVNGRMLHEGDALTSDLVLEKITPEGMIFSYKGTRFRRGVR